MSQNNLQSEQKSSRSVIGPVNPEIQSLNLVDLKKKKSQHSKVKNLKSAIQKQVKLLIKKDENILKNYIKKQQQLKKEIIKHQRSIEDKNYKQWLRLKKQQQLENKKISTQKFKTTIKEHINQAVQKNLTSKKSLAQQTKKSIKDWRLQKHLSHKNLFEHNQKNIQKIGQSRMKMRESNLKLFEKRHSQIVKTYRHEVQALQRQSVIEKRIVSKLQSDILSIREKSECKLRVIEQLEEDILNARNQSAVLTRSRCKVLSSKNALLKKQSECSNPVLESERGISSSRNEVRRMSMTLSSIDTRPESKLKGNFIKDAIAK